MSQHHQVLIIGGGNAGISVAAQLLRKRSNLEIALIEPSDKHYYQPAWTLVGGGVFNIHDTIRSESSVIPDKVKWIRDAAESFQPEINQVTTKSGAEITYDYLIVAPGIQLNWKDIEGLKQTLGRNGVTSNYSVDYATYTYECLQQLKPGQTALFTSPGTAVKCGGAPQKIMYLAADYLRKHGLQGKVNVEFVTAGGVIFGIKKYADELMKKVNEYGIKLNFKHDLVAIDGDKKTATFKVVDGEGVVSMVEKHFDMIHVVPPQSAPDFVKASPLADAGGWVDVDKFTLQHTRYKNIFGIGDAMSAPNSKTGAAVRKQAPVVVKNLLALIDGQQMPAAYSGYGSCPLVVGYGKLILAEFGYDNKVMETFPFDQSKPRWSMWVLKRYILPWLYWNKILKGTA
ncbi:FAD/NAD(P)-binding oxidoreductase [Flavihumibacter sp. ZG627]|uniref:NAD(P)/FAD-dependent oxidoreductase n=1 Tax=Flavihumibacter sp. ZG627 TaxID=1463156 RepID=UPI00057D8166|nr:FAD/NAD(P)-binding oxidoreductase [Flavihumibacter sp. ZG627]KIC91153.1 pyridine nucleotide-disulfide oxidoreductase [Flavihumibacter sp. ZG627]